MAGIATASGISDIAEWCYEGGRREVPSESSAEAKPRRDGQKPNRGNPGRTSGHGSAKSPATIGQGCRFGRGAVKAAKVTSGGLHRVPVD